MESSASSGTAPSCGDSQLCYHSCIPREVAGPESVEMVDKRAPESKSGPHFCHVLARRCSLAFAHLLDPAANRRLIKQVMIWGCVLGIPGNLAISLGPDGNPVGLLSRWPTVTTAITFVANTALTLTYVSVVVLLLSAASGTWRRRLAPLALIGRMALTNYLWQSVAMSLLFLPYGLRLEGSFRLLAYPLIAAGIFLSHLPLSAWWLARYRFGPVEWLWRMATYGGVSKCASHSRPCRRLQ